jgi:hypothetical protein
MQKSIHLKLRFRASDTRPGSSLARQERIGYGPTTDTEVSRKSGKEHPQIHMAEIYTEWA